MQGPNAGYDHPIWVDLLDRKVTFTRAAGIWFEPMAQHIHAWILAWAQGLAGQIGRSRSHQWTKVMPDDLTARTLGIIGFAGRPPGPAADFDRMHSPDRLHEVLATADYVVLCTP